MNFSPITPSAKLAAWFMRRTLANGVRRVAQINGAVATDVGSVREENQDRVALVRGIDGSGAVFILAVLADGIGGMKQGAECAALTLGSFIDSVASDAQHFPEPHFWLTNGAYRANQTVYEKFAGEGGSTLVAALLVEGQPPHWLSVGDSRAYQADNEKLHQLSLDDTIDGQLGKSGEGRRRDLLQFIGIGDALEPHIEKIDNPSGTIILTSDGVHFIEVDYLAKVIHYANDLGLCARRLTELAKMLGGPDNATVAVLKIDPIVNKVEAYFHDALEVWDPFGELQIIFDRRSRRKPEVSQASLVNPISQTIEVLDATLIDSKKAPTTTGRPKKATPKNTTTVVKKERTSRKKPKQDISKGKLHIEPDEPELFMEFPSKKT